MIDDLIKGRKYRIKHKSETQKKVRESVMRYLDEDDGSYIWSARPVAGTQTMPKEWLQSAEPVLESTDPYINKVA